MHRVIRQSPASSPNRVLARIGVGRGSVRKPTKRKHWVGAKGWLACSRASASGAGRGRSIPSPPVGRSEQGERTGKQLYRAQSFSQLSRCNWDRQGPAVTYSEAASRPPQRKVIPSPEFTSGGVRLKLAAREKEKEAA